MKALVAYVYDTDSKLFTPVNISHGERLANLSEYIEGYGVEAIITPARLTPHGLTDEPFNGHSWIFARSGPDALDWSEPELLKTAMPQGTDQLAAIPAMVADQIRGLATS